MLNINCEMALEFAKDKVWEESFKTMDDEIYIFGKQFHKIWRLKVDRDMNGARNILLRAVRDSSVSAAMPHTFSAMAERR